MLVPTPHNQAKLGDIAKTVLMPGDPLRAKYIAEHYLTDVVCYNQVRGMLGFTGYYQGQRISVQGSGMGVPSMGIYSKELLEGYEVENIIRIGSAGCLANEQASVEAKSVTLNDIIVAKNVATDSNYGISNALDHYQPEASATLLSMIEQIAKDRKTPVQIGQIYTSDTFYKEKDQLIQTSRLPILGVEMETLALYLNAKVAGKNALALFTVTDNPILGIGISSAEREVGLTTMIELALAVAVQCEKKKEDQR